MYERAAAGAETFVTEIGLDGAIVTEAELRGHVASQVDLILTGEDQKTQEARILSELQTSKPFLLCLPQGTPDNLRTKVISFQNANQGRVLVVDKGRTELKGRACNILQACKMGDALRQMKWPVCKSRRNVATGPIEACDVRWEQYIISGVDCGLVAIARKMPKSYR